METKKFTFLMRPDTQDQLVFQEVVAENQYRLKDRLPDKGAIIDIGANIGAFAVACLIRGAGHVVCFEPDAGCFNILCQNMSAWTGKVDVLNAAVWRKDEPAVFQGCEDKTACGYVIPQRLLKIKRLSVPTTDLDSIIESVTEDGSRINLLKIDAEAGEYPILYTSELLHKVDEIVGETHDYAEMDKPPGGALTNEQVHGFPAERCNIRGMTAFLESQGFVVHAVAESNTNKINHLFWASRPSALERLCQPSN